jgi:hypothetical protein
LKTNDFGLPLDLGNTGLGDKLGGDLQLGGPSYNKIPNKRAYVGIKARRKSISSQVLDGHGRMGGADMGLRDYDAMGNSADMNKYMMYYSNNMGYGADISAMHQMDSQPHKMARMSDHRDVAGAAAAKSGMFS